ncbi:PC3-like endoprotease variant A [Thelohanellus kitauei]|uniref:PC3-like endoprotease variant A n=1 Tax=Thelohanellus kitauei TaxID=669202 RepID=A0A0C2J7I4_THEKT|nr:PC3-like endoprotease variant A [Thelohanellus kitauei]
MASFDFNDNDPDPKPREEDPDNCHGTRCAGEAAAAAYNDICGVGVAYNAKIGGVRMLDGSATDALEASSLSFKNDYIDIYINCWGPKDDGKTFGKPGPLAAKALKEGASRGRKGLGSLYVWATGNGGLTDDDCNCDGYTTSIYTISIGCIGDHGLSAYYTEKCSSTIAVTFNGASHKEGKENEMITTDLFHKCTTEFKGTSASAPIAAGILALVLEANSLITWRDVQHLIVRSAKVTSPMDDGWKTNGAGLHYNHKFGFGRLVASTIVEMAKTWKNVSPQRECIGYSDINRKNIPIKSSLEIYFDTNACVNTESAVDSLEHVVLTVSLIHHRRGSLSIDLISPAGSPSQILSTRRYDSSEEGLDDWNFMTIHFWGENPSGKWKLIVTDNVHPTKVGPEENDNEDLAQRLIDRDVERQKSTWESMRQQNPYFDTDYPTGVRRNQVLNKKQPVGSKTKKTKNLPPLPGMIKFTKNLDPFISHKPIKEQTGVQRVQVSSGYDNPKVECVGSDGCSGVLIKWSITFYGTSSK